MSASTFQGHSAECLCVAGRLAWQRGVGAYAYQSRSPRLWRHAAPPAPPPPPPSFCPCRRLNFGNPWELERLNVAYPISFYGHVSGGCTD